MFSRSRKLGKPRALLPACGPFAGGVWADVGCGEGIFTQGLLEQMATPPLVIGVDRDTAALQRLGAWAATSLGHPKIQVVRADILDPLPLRRLGGVLAANVLHFVPHDMQAGVLDQFLRALKPDGRLIIVEYNAANGNSAVPHPRTASQWLDLVKRVGYADARVASRTPSTFLGEMMSLTAVRPVER